jgi:hypothetical protein
LQQARHPLLGDPVYGEARWRSLPTELRRVARDFPRPALHAWVLVARHPADGLARRFEAPVPADLKKLWSDLGGDAEVLETPPLVGQPERPADRRRQAAGAGPPSTTAPRPRRTAGPATPRPGGR